jgi:hypothetical protein
MKHECSPILEKAVTNYTYCTNICILLCAASDIDTDSLDKKNKPKKIFTSILILVPKFH